MKIATAVLCLLFIAPTVHAEELPADVQSLKGKLSLMNDDGKVVEVRTGLLKLEIDTPSALSSPLRRMKGERVVKITDSSDTYVFRIPKSSIKGENNFQVSAGDSEQDAQLISSFSKNNYQSQQVQTYEACQYGVQVPTTITSQDGNGNFVTSASITTQWYSGTQGVLVQSESWTETISVQIKTKQGELILKTQPQNRAKATRLNTLTSCG